jgi:sortase A
MQSMRDKRSLAEFSITELEQQLYRQKRRQRHQRLHRLKREGRVVEVSGLSPPDAALPPIVQTKAARNGATEPLAPQTIADDLDELETENMLHHGIQWRWVVNKFLFLVEVTAVISLFVILFNLWRTQTELNQELAQIQQAESLSLALPTPTATPVIDVVILPGGHKPPIDGRPPIPEEAGYIPPHLLPAINAYVPPPIPTPAPEQARRIQIPAIKIDSPVVQGMYDWEQLKKGVAQKIGSAGPGQVGNMALAGHNDIYGEVFRNLDKLSPGDEITVSTERQSYTYIVRDTKVVDPTEVWVMEPTEYASVTLISCYPYRVNTKRIAVFADLVQS